MLSVRGIFKKGVAFPMEEIQASENQSVIITFLEDLEEPVENTAPESEIDPIKALRG
jgi:hypothetical protein